MGLTAWRKVCPLIHYGAIEPAFVLARFSLMTYFCRLRRVAPRLLSNQIAWESLDEFDRQNGLIMRFSGVTEINWVPSLRRFQRDGNMESPRIEAGRMSSVPLPQLISS